MKYFKIITLSLFSLLLTSGAIAQNTSDKTDKKEQRKIEKQAAKAAKLEAKAKAKQDKILAKEQSKLAANTEAEKKKLAKEQSKLAAKAKAEQKKTLAKEKLQEKTIIAENKNQRPWKKNVAKASSKPKDEKKTTASTTATETYTDLGYKTSTDQFLESSKELTMEDKRRMANAFRLNHEVDRAATWYAKIVDKSNDPIDKLRFAQVLQSSGNSELASTYYNKYTEAVKDNNQWSNVASIFANNIDNKDRFMNHDIHLVNETNINSEKLEYSPTLYKDGVIFVSTKKPDAYPSIGEDPWIKDNFMSLYYAPEGETGLLSEASTFSYDITTKFHEGPVTFSRGHNQIFFTRNAFNHKKRTNSKDGVMKLQIFTSYRDGNTWSTPEELSFNTPEYEEAHPALSPDGSKLYFTSDRPGGFGGMDLYVSELENGEWGAPKNMGADINTPGNELFPFVHETGMMFFASNGHDGLGGLDIFTASETQDGWSQVNNVGKPFNSIKDDFGFVINAEGDKGYLTSARTGGNGKDDIYSFELPPNTFNSTPITLCTYDEETGDRISGVEVIRINKNVSRTSLGELFVKLELTEQPDEYKLRLKNDFPEASNLVFHTDINGEYELTASYDEKYMFQANAPGYHVGNTDFIVDRSKREYCIPLKKKIECIELKGAVMTTSARVGIPTADIILTDEDGKEINITADNKGGFDFGCIPCDQQYTLTASKGEQSTSARVSTVNVTCDPTNKITKELFLDDPNIKNTEPYIAAGDVIVLENIFYDFDKYYIRSDAEPDLNKVVALMNKYPSMIIELGSHTDARGRYAYNEKLSSNRAKSAVDYIVSRGIDGRRIVAKGYGETTPRNQCVDGVKCSETEHQFNRRTEIKVISLGRTDVKVQYNDNRPDYIDPAPASKRIDDNIEWRNN